MPRAAGAGMACVHSSADYQRTATQMDGIACTVVVVYAGAAGAVVGERAPPVRSPRHSDPAWAVRTTSLR